MSIWIQISSGRGPEECSWVLAQVADLMEQEALSLGINLDLIEKTQESQHVIFHSIVYSADLKEDDLWLSSWIGTIQWIGKSTFRPHHRRKNWYIGVQILEQAQSLNWSFDSSELKLETFRASGSGGQNVNKVSTAVRLTHLPTGKSVTAQDERSQLQNRKLAMERLKRLMQIENENSQSKTKQLLWSQHQNLERGNPIRVYVGKDFRRQT